MKPLLAVPVPSQNGRIYNDKSILSLLVVAAMNRDAERFLDRPRMLRHVANAHREKRFICDWEGCGKAFVDNSKLQRHRVTHTQEDCFSATSAAEVWFEVQPEHALKERPRDNSRYQREEREREIIFVLRIPEKVMMLDVAHLK